MVNCPNCKAAMVNGSCPTCSRKIKDQSGVDASSQWLQDRGHATHGPRATRKTVENRTTEPVTFDHWQTVVDMGRCLACGGLLNFKRNRGTGGGFHICDTKDCGWYIGYEVAKAVGHQVKISGSL